MSPIASAWARWASPSNSAAWASARASYEIQEMSRALAAIGVAFEPKNLVTTVMTDTATGDIRPDILDEKVMSAILEIKVPVARTEEIVRTVWAVEKRLDTIVVLGVGTRCDENGEDRVVAPILERQGYTLHRAKTNLGLGRKILRKIEPEEFAGARARAKEAALPRPTPCTAMARPRPWPTTMSSSPSRQRARRAAAIRCRASSASSRSRWIITPSASATRPAAAACGPRATIT